MFVAGLCLFFALHGLTVTPRAHALLVARLGALGWKGLMTAGSLAGIGLIVAGWGQASSAPLFAPLPLAVASARWLVPLAFILVVCGGAGLPGYIRRHLHHPMLIGVTLWALVHLLANGGTRQTLLFGCFVAFGLYALTMLLGAGKRATFTPRLKWDVLAVALGLIVAIGFMHGHLRLFGVPGA